MKRMVWIFLLSFCLAGSVFSEEGQAPKAFSSESDGVDEEIEMPATNLTKMKVVAIAKEYAVTEGKDLLQYPKIVVRFDIDEGVWHVSFMMDPMPPGGNFDVLIDDKTGKVVDFWLGE